MLAVEAKENLFMREYWFMSTFEFEFVVFLHMVMSKYKYRYLYYKIDRPPFLNNDDLFGPTQIRLMFLT
jgi:hypothetical protein